MRKRNPSKLIAGAKWFQRESRVLWLVCLDPRTPWNVKALAIAMLVYTVSPFDLIPEAIPVIGFVDDLILIPLGIYLTLKMAPSQVLTDCRAKAIAGSRIYSKTKWIVAGLVALVWIAFAIYLSGS